MQHTSTQIRRILEAPPVLGCPCLTVRLSEGTCIMVDPS